MANLNFVFTIIIYFVGCRGTTAQGSQMVNNFFNQLSEQSMNMQGMSSMNKLPSVITMGKNCGMNSGINNGMPNSAIQNSGIPNSYMNPSGANMNPPRVNSVYMGASGQCPCMMTVNSIGCPTCDCKQQGKGNKVDSIVEQKPIATEKDDIQTTATATMVSTATLLRVLLSSTLTHRQNDTSSNKNVTTLFTTKGSTNAPQTKSSIQSHFKAMHNGPTTISDDALTSPIVFVQNKTFDGLGVVNQKQYKKHDIFTREHSFPMAIAFGSAFIVVFVVASIFFCLWRSAARQLKHEQNELYFAEKSIRQGSIVSQIQNEMSRKEDSVFSKVQPLDSLPELPARPTSPLTPTAPPFQLTPVKQTTFEFPQEESKHDYLELI